MGCAGLRAACMAATALSLLAPGAPAIAQWQPTRPVELIVPAGTGGGADQMARLLQSAVIQHRLMEQPLVVRNLPAEGGAQGLMAAKGGRGDPHKLIITLSNLFTTPLSSGIPFSWRDLTPVTMLALDEFVLWVPADAPYRSVGEFVAALQAGKDGQIRMAGTGSKQEDQLVTTALERFARRTMTYVPFAGGGAVAAQLAEKQVDATVNNPIEGLANWRDGKVKPLCVFDSERMPYTARVTQTMSWRDIPTCREAGVDVVYLMLRGIFMPAGVTPEQVGYYVDLFDRVRATPEWQQFMQTGAFNQTTMSGAAFVNWLEQAESYHETLMREAGFLARR